jgi:acyl-CoA dehydrogenase
MDFALSANQESIRDAIGKICSRFDDAYWLKKDKEGGYPADFHRALADAGWLGICIPEEYGGSGLGITDAAIMMRTISESGAGMSGASAVHMNVFGLNPVVVFGTRQQCARMLPPIISGADKSCFAVTEPNTGLNTTQLKTRAVRKGDKYIVNGQKVWISTAQVANKILLLARTTPLEEVKSPTRGLSLFYTDFDRNRIAALGNCLKAKRQCFHTSRRNNHIVLTDGAAPVERQFCYLLPQPNVALNMFIIKATVIRIA